MEDRAGPTGETLPHTSCGVTACATAVFFPSAVPCVPNVLTPLSPRRKHKELRKCMLELAPLSHEEPWPGLPRIVSASQCVGLATALEAWISTTGECLQG